MPGVTDKGMRTKALVELVDVFPSLADVAGIPVPPLCPEGENVYALYIINYLKTIFFRIFLLVWKDQVLLRFLKILAGRGKAYVVEKRDFT